MTTNDTLVNDANDLGEGGREYYSLSILIVAILVLGALALGSSIYLRRFRRHDGRGLRPRHDTETYDYGRRSPTSGVRTLTGSLSEFGADSLPPSYPDLPPSYEDACKTRLGLDNMGFCAVPELPQPPPYEAAASNASHPSTSTLVHTPTSQQHVQTSTLVHTPAQTEPCHAETTPQSSTDLLSEPTSSRSESHNSQNPQNSAENSRSVSAKSSSPNDGTVISAASLNRASTSSESQSELTSGVIALARRPEMNSETAAEEQCGFYV